MAETKYVNALGIVKGDERFIFIYDDEHRADALRALGRYATNPDLNFNWYDAAVLSKKIRDTPKPSQPEA